MSWLSPTTSLVPTKLTILKLVHSISVFPEHWFAAWDQAKYAELVLEIFTARSNASAISALFSYCAWSDFTAQVLHVQSAVVCIRALHYVPAQLARN